MITATMISKWLEQNGGPRKLQQGDNSDFLAIRRFLEKHGYKLNGHRYRFVVSKGRPFKRKFDRRGAEGPPRILARAA